ncbi:MAG TPA: class I SAM-dependent methyltransferase [Pyrinomonadaceae bacterium]
MNITELLDNPPPIHRPGGGEEFMQMGLAPQVLTFIDSRINADSHTLETGAGVSTILFAMKGAHHTAITPVAGEIERIQDYCRSQGIDVGNMNFVCEPSALALPRLDPTPLDLVLIDGLHGFPSPFIDFFYTAGRLKIGGLLIIDDIQLQPCAYMRDVLAEQPQWRCEADFSPRSIVFRKLAEGTEWGDWTDQPYVLRNSGYNTSTSASRFITHLQRGEFSEITKKIKRRLSIG